MNRYTAMALLAALLFATPAFAAVQAKETGNTPEAQHATQALNILEAQGYGAGLQDKSMTAFRDFQPQGAGFVATIPQDGRTYVVNVNPRTGQVRQQN
jgi:hypothetical protein